VRPQTRQYFARIATEAGVMQARYGLHPGASRADVAW